ncbi:MAG: ACT domain-containing protein [Candidatus Omnitrophica bacterium]|nr:ACT domain-containing protein [Candidatus Omnitrophota bacterium]MCF7877838.1 ACT domain-containing protein [Candidatus Omnitrophota bacterium]MCF7892515.1 ACT domain-containing protein [Candidatus Omnitrophota bacterium]MCF7895853.1 ACT domain-containing protein [Candidatus Omnitrophota bacterium]MCF7897614.1 ACT domain-containing protein [Candidatus Omnitrophota bacterium]
MKGVKATELIVSLEEKSGALGEVTSLLKQEGINIRAISGWIQQDTAMIRVVTSDNQRAKEVLSSRFEISEKEIVIVGVPDKIGNLDSLSNLLKEAGVNMTHIYGTTSGEGQSAALVLASSDNDKAIEVISA